MNKILRHIVAYFASVLVVVATGGMGLVKHYCSCEDEGRPTVAAASSQQAHDAMPCCEIPVQEEKDACCGDAEPPLDESEGHACHTGHACCWEEYAFFKTDQVDMAGSQSAGFKFQVAYQQEILAEETVEHDCMPVVSRISDRAPPDDHGITLLIRIHQLKTAHLLS